MHKCSCKPECEAVVKSDKRKYARGHNPASRTGLDAGHIFAQSDEGKQVLGNITKKRHKEWRRLHPKPKRRKIYCQCSLDCTAIVRGKRKGKGGEYKYSKYARGHHPHSAPPPDAAQRAVISRKLKIYYKTHKGTASSEQYTKKVRKHMSDVWHETHMSKDGHGPRWGAKHTEVTKELMSEIRQDMIRYGVETGWPKGKDATYVGKHGTIKMRSWWEVRFAEWLDSIHIKWLYEPKSFFVGDEGWGGFTYTPDFYIPRQRVWIEIKGWLTAQADWKMERFRQWYPTKHLWMFNGRQLKAAGVIQ